MKKQVKVGVGYGRVSTMSQAEDEQGFYRDDSSPEIQKQRNEKYVKGMGDATCRYELIDHLSDVGFSGKDMRRPAFQEMVGLVKAKKIDFIIATDLSRLSRSLSDFLEFAKTCKDNNVSLVVIGQNFDTSTAMGQLQTNLFMILYEFERQITGERVKQNAQIRLVNDGKINGATEALGLDSISDKSRKGHFQINKAEARILEKIFQEFVATRSKKMTFEYIQNNKIQWKQDKPFTKQRFDLMFKMAFYRYRGEYPINLKEFEKQISGKAPEKKCEMVKLPHGPVIDLALLDKVATILTTQRPGLRASEKSYTYILSGILFSKDNHRFQGQPGKGDTYRYYYNPVKKHRVSCEDLDKKIFSCLSDYLNDKEKLTALVDKSQSERNIKKYEKLNLIKTIEAKKAQLELEKVSVLERAEGFFNSGSTSNQELINLLNEKAASIQISSKELDAKMIALKEELEELSLPIKSETFEKMLKDTTRKLMTLPNDQKKSLMLKIYERIILNEEDEVLELHYRDELFGISGRGLEKPKLNLGKLNAPSSGLGMNGGSNKT
jgi:DNA invertase Pin-like site-specific DNA recombinase